MLFIVGGMDPSTGDAIDELHGLQIAYDWVAPTPAPAPVPSAAPTVHWTPWYQAQVSAAARALH